MSVELNKLTEELVKSDLRRKLAGGDVVCVLREEGIDSSQLPSDFLAEIGTLSEKELNTIANINLKANAVKRVASIDGGIIF